MKIDLDKDEDAFLMVNMFASELITAHAAERDFSLYLVPIYYRPPECKIFDYNGREYTLTHCHNENKYAYFAANHPLGLRWYYMTYLSAPPVGFPDAIEISDDVGGGYFWREIV